MKALFLPHSDHSRGQLQGLRNVLGPWNVEVYDYIAKVRSGEGAVDRGFVDMVAHGQPGLVWMHLQDTGVIRADAIERARAASPTTRFVHWIGDYTPQISPYVASISAACDHTLISSRGQLAQYFAAGARDVTYCQVGIDWTRHVLFWPGWEPPFRVPDVVFAGNCYSDGPWPIGTAERLRAIRALRDAKVDVGVVGSGWPKDIPVVGTCTTDDQQHVYRRAKVVLNVNHANNVECYYSNRMLIAMASGTPTVTRHVPGLEDEFDESELFWYRDEDELVGHVAYLLRDPHLAATIGAAGRYKVMREHSWFTRIVDVLAQLDGIL